MPERYDYIDWEHEAQKDYMFSLERQKDIENSWWEHEEKRTKIEVVKLNTYEKQRKSSSFRRAYKKINLLRSHLPIKADRTTV